VSGARSHRAGGRGWRHALPHLCAWALVMSGLASAAQAAWIPAKAELAQLLLARAFADGLQSGHPSRPWPWADTAPVAKVSAPRLRVSEIVLSGGSGEAMAFGPTMLVDRSAARVTVLAAHRDTHFAFVRDLRVGDSIELERIDGSLVTYRVTGFQTLRWDRFAYPAQAPRDMLALATCYPFGGPPGSPLRRVVWAERDS
jgi:sortase A